MNTLDLEKELAEKYGYKKLSDGLSEKYRNIFTENIADFLNVDGDKIKLFSSAGTLICNGYTRIVVGDYGAFIEFNGQQANLPFKVKRGQEYRIYCPSFGKYEWYTADDGSDIKIYRQKGTVKYADYKVGMFYVSVHECKIF